MSYLGIKSIRMGRKEASISGKIIFIYGYGQNPSTHSNTSCTTWKRRDATVFLQGMHILYD